MTTSITGKGRAKRHRTKINMETNSGSLCKQDHQLCQEKFNALLSDDTWFFLLVSFVVCAQIGKSGFSTAKWLFSLRSTILADVPLYAGTSKLMNAIRFHFDEELRKYFDELTEGLIDRSFTAG